MSYLFLLYLLVSAGFSIGGTVLLVQSARTFGGFLFLIGSILLFTFYGLRWFYGNIDSTNGSLSGTWPPSINLCPDYLVLYKKNATENVCIDTVGVSPGGIQKFIDPTNATNNNYVFRLFENLKGKERLTALCGECAAKKVSWEGVYDGVSCLSPKQLPRTDGSVDSL